MAKNISAKEYWTEVESLAAECVKLAKENDSDLADEVHEMVDGHEWVIYTAAYFDVLKHTGSDDNIDANIESVQGADDWNAMLMLAVYFALSGDVLAKAEQLLESEDDEGTEEDED